MDESKALDWVKMKRDALLAVHSARNLAQAAMDANPSYSKTFGEWLARLRIADPRGRASGSKAMVRALSSATEETRWLLAILGPGNGVARGILDLLPHLDLDEEHRYLVAVACAEVDPERTLEHLDRAGLVSLPYLLCVLLVAMVQQPVLDFEEEKKIEILYLSGESGNPSEERNLRRRFEQSRAQTALHQRHHQLRSIPLALCRDSTLCFTFLCAMMDHDPYGSLLCLRNLPPPHPLEVITLEQRLLLLERAASFGLGLASNHLDMFCLPEDPAILDRLKALFAADLTAGSSIYGVYALEGIHHYPFGVGKIEPVLPRRISSVEALAYLKQDEPEGAKARTFNTIEIGNAMTMLQDREVRRFLERLNADISLEWKAWFPLSKREVVFADLDLKIRNILFLIAHAAFLDNAAFDALLAAIGSCHPSTAGNPAHLHLLANRYLFLEILGLNPGLLFNSPQRASNPPRAPIEEVKNFRILYLLHVGMSIYIHVGDALFRNVPIAWNLLQNQGDGTLDSAVQEVLAFFDAFDTLLVLGRPIVPSLREWILQIVDALAQGIPEVPVASPEPPSGRPLRLITREAVGRYRELLNSYCLQVLRHSAGQAGLSPINILQNLRLPRSKTDKLFSLLEEDRKSRKLMEPPQRS